METGYQTRDHSRGKGPCRWTHVPDARLMAAIADVREHGHGQVTVYVADGIVYKVDATRTIKERGDDAGGS